MRRVGYWLSEKKCKRLNFEEKFKGLCRSADIELVKLDLDLPLEEQGPFDLIVQKLTDLIAKASQGHEHAGHQVELFRQYVASHPEVVIVDPLENVLRLMDRHEQYCFVDQCEELQQECSIFTPTFVEFTSTDVEVNKKLMEESKVQYPFVCKPTVAHGSRECHKMAIIFNEAGLHDVCPPCVAQTFINHGALLFKVFVLGPRQFVVRRPSIKNFSAGEKKTIFFDSHDVSKANSACFLNVLDEEDTSVAEPQPDLHKIALFSEVLREKLGVHLFGIDLIVENHTGRYAVIDINAFPGYDGVPDFYQLLLNFIHECINQGPDLHQNDSSDPPPHKKPSHNKYPNNQSSITEMLSTKLPVSESPATFQTSELLVKDSEVKNTLSPVQSIQTDSGVDLKDTEKEARLLDSPSSAERKNKEILILQETLGEKEVSVTHLLSLCGHTIDHQGESLDTNGDTQQPLIINNLLQMQNNMTAGDNNANNISSNNTTTDFP